MSKSRGKNQKKDDDKKEDKKDEKKMPSRFSEMISQDNKEWLQKNWKMTLIVIASTFLVFFMKIHEESGYSNREKKHGDNLYEILGLDASSSIKDIKRQYNKLAIELHPDKHPNCTTCEEKFTKISHAYEVLSDEEKKLHYDETEGILESIKSGAKPIYAHNYQKTVLESPYLWLIQIYSEHSSTCQTFSGFWEEFIEEFDYLKFGRVHVVSQKNLLPKLPFAIDDIPFVFSISQKENSEVLEYSYDSSPNSAFRGFVRKSIGVHYYELDTNKFSQILKSRPTQKAVINVFTDNIPVPFAYFAFRHSEFINFYTTLQGNYKPSLSLLKKPRTSSVVIHEEELNVEPIREFEIGSSKNALKSLLSYVMMTSIPRLLIRNLSFFVQRIL